MGKTQDSHWLKIKLQKSIFNTRIPLILQADFVKIIGYTTKLRYRTINSNKCKRGLDLKVVEVVGEKKTLQACSVQGRERDRIGWLGLLSVGTVTANER